MVRRFPGTAPYVLDVSPHYFVRRSSYPRSMRYRDVLQAEIERNRSSRAKLVECLLPLKPDMRVLDFGCGPGFAAAAVLPRVKEVVAVDVSSGALACAEELHPGPTYIRVPTDHLPSLGHFDLIYSFAVFQHLENQRAMSAFRELRGALAPGGVALIHLPIGTHLPPDARLRRYRMHYDRFPEEELRRELHGFSELTIRPVADLCGQTDDDVTHQHIVSFGL
jgi:cyclopropane fatty-acyl-phospholipid synthase-like methyltransferase